MNASSDIEQACQIMGLQFHSTDQFISRAAQWLSKASHLEIAHLQGVWRISGIGYGAVADTIQGALAKAVIQANPH